MESVKTIIRNNKAAWQQVEDNVIVVTSQTRKMHILEGVGGRIWQLLENPMSRNELIEKIQIEYDAPPWQIQEDIDNFLKELSEKLIIKING
ncbi:MAG: PqqD family protein [Candidatus Omnitrophica bacterium]|nr:PqqD family protein [Candidatus Omnitrophota bacterium]